MDYIFKLPTAIQDEMTANNVFLNDALKEQYPDLSIERIELNPEADGSQHKSVLEVLSITATVITPILVELLKIYIPRTKQPKIIEKTTIIKTKNHGEKEVTEITVEIVEQ